ncbi:MAG: DUF2029 domain-containing protein [Deltaproteobacteria bacterium]|nr:DUF2029 domain-containing protein [Deltaproteobacteria bacterium]
MPLLTRTRLTVYPLIFLACYLAAGGVNIAGGLLQGAGLVDLQGKPVGSDFVTFWAGSVLAHRGHPEAVYQGAALKAVVQKATGAAREYPWHYPPGFLLFTLPLGLLPYLWSLGIWLAATLSAYLGVVRAWAPHPLGPWLALAFPGAFQNFFQGQNGFLSTALLGGGLLLLDRRPWLAGALLGLLTYKPHLAVLVPVVLLATPFAFDYDPALLAVPLTCLGRQGWEEGCSGSEQALLTLAYLTPFLAPAAARFLSLPLAPVILAALLTLVVRRVYQGFPRPQVKEGLTA